MEQVGRFFERLRFQVSNAKRLKLLVLDTDSLVGKPELVPSVVALVKRHLARGPFPLEVLIITPRGAVRHTPFFNKR